MYTSRYRTYQERPFTECEAAGVACLPSSLLILSQSEKYKPTPKGSSAVCRTGGRLQNAHLQVEHG